MSSASPSQEVPVDVLPPVPKDGKLPASGVARSRAPFEGLATFYHPASGVVILGLDWLIFGTDFVTGFLALPEMCVVGFLLSFFFVALIQRRWSKDTRSRALGKAFLGAFMVGLPFPITGTILGAAILVLSGLPHHPAEALKRLVSQATAK